MLSLILGQDAFARRPSKNTRARIRRHHRCDRSPLLACRRAPRMREPERAPAAEHCVSFPHGGLATGKRSKGPRVAGPIRTIFFILGRRRRLRHPSSIMPHPVRRRFDVIHGPRAFSNARVSRGDYIVYRTRRARTDLWRNQSPRRRRAHETTTTRSTLVRPKVSQCNSRALAWDRSIHIGTCIILICVACVWWIKKTLSTHVVIFVDKLPLANDRQYSCMLLAKCECVDYAIFARLSVKSHIS